MPLVGFADHNYNNKNNREYKHAKKFNRKVFHSINILYRFDQHFCNEQLC